MTSSTAFNYPGIPILRPHRRKKVRSAGEGDDGYARVVVMLDARTRVIECSDGVQWAIQKCGKAVPRLWRSDLYFRSKAGLLFYADAPELRAFPDWFPERGAKRGEFWNRSGNCGLYWQQSARTKQSSP